MTMVMAMGIGLMMTAIAVAIGGLVIEAVLLMIHHSLKSAAETVNEQASHAVVFRFERSDDLAGAVEWTEEVAA
jgi:ABC-type transport system involved in cytochrome bd biosynthesis fused ATPase/permease subunit